MLPFMLSLDKAEVLRSSTKLKKGEEPRVSSMRTMSGSSDLLIKHDFIMEANRIRKFLDIVGRMRGLGSLAMGFYKVLKKGKVQGIAVLKDNVDNWRGMCLRSFDYTQLPLCHSGPTLNALERRFIAWPAALRTALNQAEYFLKGCCLATGLPLITPNPMVLQKHMQAAEFVLASKLDQLLFESTTGGENFEGSGAPGISFVNGGMNSTKRNGDWDLPCVKDVDPELLKPILQDSLMLQIPDELPKEKKGTKKGGARGKSASTRKVAKKKRK